jgi:hypothetical protein
VPAPRRPTKRQLLAARGRTIPDVIAPRLSVQALHQAGHTDRLMSPFDDKGLIGSGIGITNVVARATASEELSAEELRSGAEELKRKLCHFGPLFVATLGVGRTAHYQLPDLVVAFDVLRTAVRAAGVRPPKDEARTPPPRRAGARAARSRGASRRHSDPPPGEREA